MCAGSLPVPADRAVMESGRRRSEGLSGYLMACLNRCTQAGAPKTVICHSNTPLPTKSSESFETEAKEKLFLPSYQQMLRLPAAAGGPT